ncbi:glycosyltransferase [Sulfitobacter sp. 1A13368]|uniref:glycosyltransferase n=1 Tax=Sulfitobacter sp. 1A13368 TaxID=3368593 RepID=UPI0037460A7E
MTVGTGSFEGLTQWADNSDIDCTIQFGRGSAPTRKKAFAFTEDFEDYCGNFDFIITHAGAGTVYKLLAAGRNLIVVPNVDRIDLHQLEIFRYLRANSFALCFTLQELSSLTRPLDFYCNDFLSRKISYFNEGFDVSGFVNLICPEN